MAKLYETENDKGFLLYPYGHHLILRNKADHYFGRPITVSADYANGLSDVIYSKSIYYTYISVSGALHVKSLMDQTPVFSIKNTMKNSIKTSDKSSDKSSDKNHTKKEAAPEYTSPRLIVFDERLLLLYIEKNPDTRNHQLRGCFPLENDTSLEFPPVCADILPSFDCCSLNNCLVLTVYSDHQPHILILESNLNLRELPIDQAPAEETQAISELVEQQTRYEQYIGELEQTCMQLESQLSDQQSQVLASQSELEHTRSLLDKSQSELDHTRTQLSSAVTQYNELMNVAEEYKKEADIWYNKYVTRT